MLFRSPDVLGALRDEGFVRFAEGDAGAFTAFPQRSPRVVLVTGTDTKLGGTDALADLSRAFVGRGASVTAVDAYDDHGGTTPLPERGAAVAPVRGDRTLSARVSTVDDPDHPAGVVATVLTVADPGTVGHYGFGTGARALLPEAPTRTGP